MGTKVAPFPSLMWEVAFTACVFFLFFSFLFFSFLFFSFLFFSFLFFSFLIYSFLFFSFLFFSFLFFSFLFFSFLFFSFLFFSFLFFSFSKGSFELFYRVGSAEVLVKQLLEKNPLLLCSWVSALGWCEGEALHFECDQAIASTFQGN